MTKIKNSYILISYENGMMKWRDENDGIVDDGRKMKNGEIG